MDYEDNYMVTGCSCKMCEAARGFGLLPRKRNEARNGARVQALKDASKTVFSKTKEHDMTTLYKYNEDGKEVYGKRLAIDGMSWVMKSLDSGKLTVIGAREAVEVLPYTVKVRFVGDAASRTYDYIAKEGEVTVGSLLFIESTTGMATVVAVDTKSKSAAKSLTGWLLSGTPLTVVSVEDK